MERTEQRRPSIRAFNVKNSVLHLFSLITFLKLPKKQLFNLKLYAMTKYLILLFIISINQLFAQNDVRIVKLNASAIQEKLKNTPQELSLSASKNQAEASGVLLELPMADGSQKTFKVIESPLMSPQLAKRFPEIKTYRAYSVENNGESSGLFTVAPSGVYGLFFTEKGNVLIAPKNILLGDHEVLYQDDVLADGKCENGDEHLKSFGKNFKENATQTYSNGSTLRTYRISILTTGEFYTNNGSTLATAQAAIVSMVNSLKAVYEKEASVSFTLASTKIYIDAATDPFNGTSPLKAAETFGELSVSDPTNFALSTYDIGHAIQHSPGGGGAAYLNGPCRNNNLSGLTSPIKAGGWSGGTTTSLATFIHEVGHQFSAGHTFNSINSGCNGNIMTGSSYEPGSGSTYMSYWGNCSPDNISGAVTRTYFHTNSLESIISYSTNTGTCSVNTATGNTPPVVNANPNSRTLTIPKGTPFTLTGSGTDANAETILYNWEQYNLGTTRGGADDAQNSTDSPIFRTFAPAATGNVRTFPALNAILGGSIANNDEALPQVARTINMRLTGRDNNSAGGGIHCASINLTVDNSGPFLLTSQNTNTYWVQGSTKTITWSVNNTNVAPLNCTNVDILFSSDNGLTFPTVLLSNTPNDGNQSIIVPTSLTTTGRIKIIPTNVSLIFFDINNTPINIVNSLPVCAAETSTLTPTAAVSALAGDAALNIILFPHIVATSVSRTTAVTDPTMSFTGYNGSSCVTPYSNITYFKTYTFRVSASGSYTFTIGGSVGSKNLNLYTGSFVGGCTNWVAATVNLGGSPVYGSSMTANLTTNTTYVMTISSTISTGSVGTVIVNFSGAGTILQPIPGENSFYSYSYVVVNNATNGVKAIQSNSDLRNVTTFPVGNYTLYGISNLTDNVDFSGYINQPFSNLQTAITNGTICAKVSDNSIQININNCQNALNLSGGAVAGMQNANLSITATQVINSGQNVTYRAGNSITLMPSAGSGFSVASGSVFIAEIGGCN